ncbi:MAG: translation initiation factor IF-2 [Opitutales bacterium]
MTSSSSSEKGKAADSLPAEKSDKEPTGEEPEAPSKEVEPVEEEVKALQLKPPIVVRDFAVQLGLKPFRLISELMEMGIFASMNQVIDENVASDIAAKYGFILDIRHRGEPAAAPEKKKVKEVVKVDESKFLEPRPPVVCILGHVDHGKTTLLDSIRKASVVSGEAGGITQHIGAYQIEVNDQRITFLDTPGHAAFTKMRARGADVTDLAILLVAADDGFMPQTDEALKHAQSAGVPIIVAINKMDAKGANIERVKKQMQERNIAPEDWGGEIITVPVSAIKGEGVDELLEMILLQAEVSELKANPKAPAEGVIIEAEVEVGRGPSATVIIQKGTLKAGDALVCGRFYAKARALYDDQGKIVKKAPPSMPVRVIGWSDAPEAGALFRVVKNEKEARRIAEENQELQRKDGIAQIPVAPAPTIENLFDAIASTKKKTFRTVLRCDVQGSLEAVRGMLENINSDKVDIDVIQADVGPISQSDVLMASTSQAAIIGFGVKVESGVVKFAKHHGVKIFQHNIIYELLDQVKEGMADLLEPELHEKKLGAAEIRQVFPVGKGTVAGCLVTEGKITRDAKARLLRKGEEVFDSTISTLKRFKEDAKDVRAGYECGIALTRFRDYEPGDIIECYEIQKKRGSL